MSAVDKNSETVSGNGHGAKADVRADPPAERRRSPWPLALIAALFVFAAFLTWYFTWFGRELSDEQIATYLTEENKPRHVQHALSQIAEKINRGDQSVKRWYPQVVALAASPLTEIRMTVAWVLGHDNTSEEFHAALLGLLEDREPVVRRNAAVQLVRFNKDARGRAELRAILQPYVLNSPYEGVVDNVLPDKSIVTIGALVARLRPNNGSLQEIRAPLPGKISGVKATEGTSIKAGDELLTLAPDPDFVWEALRALYYVGEADDLASVERFAQGIEGMPERVKEQAARTVTAIQSRSQKNTR
jgi:hypothetical protein